MSRKRNSKEESDDEWSPEGSEDEMGDESQHSEYVCSDDDDYDSPPKAKRQRLTTKLCTKSTKTNKENSNKENTSNSNENSNENSKIDDKENDESKNESSNEGNDVDNENDNEIDGIGNLDSDDNEDNEDNEDGANKDGGHGNLNRNEAKEAARAAKIEKIKKEYAHALKQINKLSSAKEYKEILTFIKNLRDGDRDTPLSSRVKLQGKKDELLSRVKEHVLSILMNKAPMSQSSFGRYWSTWFRGNNVDWNEWKKSLIEFIDSMVDKKNKSQKRKESGIFDSKYNQSMKNLEQRLQTLEKEQIVQLVISLVEKDQETRMNDHGNNNNNNGNNGNNENKDESQDLMTQVLNLLPQPNLDEMFDKHKKLIAAISKAKPWTRYGSSSDHYSFKRCKSAITHARNAMINDGNYLLKTKEWDVIINYLKISIKHCDDFPTWDCPSDNGDAEKVKNALKKMYLQTCKALGLDLNDNNEKNKSKRKSKSNKDAMTDEMKQDLEEIKAYFDK